MFSELHAGLSRMRGLGRSAVWWPGLHKDVAGFVKNCAEYKLHDKTPHGNGLLSRGQESMLTMLVHFWVSISRWLWMLI